RRSPLARNDALTQAPGAGSSSEASHRTPCSAMASRFKRRQSRELPPLHKPPLALWLMALSMKLFGVNELAARLPSVVLSTAGVYLTFCTGRLLFDPVVGLIAAALPVMNGILLDLAAGRRATDHVDTVLLFFISLGVYAVALDQVRPRWRAVVLIGLCTGCAYLTKSHIALLIPVLWVAALVGREQPKRALAARFLAMLALATA